jgi:ABC-type nitrate/sulfonate/bicarbonate transport system substrate-binding protein
MKRLIILLLVLSMSSTGCVRSNLDNSGVKNVKIGYQHSDLHSALFVAEEKGILAGNNPELVRDLMKIHNESTEYIKNNPEKAAEIAARRLGTNLDVEKESIRHIGFSAVPAQENIDSILIFADSLKKAGTLTSNLTREDIFDLRNTG